MGSATDDFDIIVVGGGTAGLVIANRLSEDPNLQVLILEAGKNKNDDPKIYMPAILTQTWGDPDYDWVYETVPQENLNGRKILHPRGKGIASTPRSQGRMLTGHCSAWRLKRHQCTKRAVSWKSDI